MSCDSNEEFKLREPISRLTIAQLAAKSIIIVMTSLRCGGPLLFLDGLLWSLIHLGRNKEALEFCSERHRLISLKRRREPH